MVELRAEQSRALSVDSNKSTNPVTRLLDRRVHNIIPVIDSPIKSVNDGVGSKAAFTLIELAIVLVVIGLLVGGVMSGQALIKAAELRAVVTEHQRYKTAVMIFKDKYRALPGDMKNATKFWGEAHATPATCKTTASTGKETCDGDGDGKMESGAVTNEIYRFWQHLANAGLIEGQYSGSTGSGSSVHSVIGTNIPASKLTNAGWTINYIAGTYVGATYWFSGIYQNYFEFGTARTNSTTWDPILTPEEAWNIDVKIDDGKPGMGEVISNYWNTCTDAADKDDTDADYLLTDTTVRCALIFRRQF